MTSPTNDFYKTVAIWILSFAAATMGILYNNVQADIKELRSSVDKMKDERVTQSDLVSFKEEVRSEMRAMGANIDNKLNTLLYVVSGGNPPKK